MKVAGIDLSSHAVDLVLLDETTDDATWSRYHLVGHTPFERARSLRRSFPTRSFWEDEGVYLIGIEDPPSAYAHVAKALGLATGAVAALIPLHLTMLQLPSAEWKRVFTGHAKADKNMVAAHAAEHHGFAPGNHNASDAYAIAWAARHINQQAITKGAA